MFDRLIEACVRDLHALMMPLDGGELLAAGIPWYVAPFGRDSLLAASEALMINPRSRAARCWRSRGCRRGADDPWRDAEPGKIPHELRSGELARSGHIPHTPYYGTVDATPLFVMVAGAYYRWTGDLETLARLRRRSTPPSAGSTSGATATATDSSSTSGARPPACVNHGWKDSGDSVVHADGSLRGGRSRSSRSRATSTRRSCASPRSTRRSATRSARQRCARRPRRCGGVQRRLLGSRGGVPGSRSTGAKAQVRSVTSNPAHCLYCGIVDDERAAPVAERLMAPDMFSGWGIRTLSSSSKAYNPMSYHNGSVWPHDNAIAAAGLKRYGVDAATARIATGLFDVAAGGPRLPPARALLRFRPGRVAGDRRLPGRLHPAGVGRDGPVHAACRRCSASPPTRPKTGSRSTGRACPIGSTMSRSTTCPSAARGLASPSSATSGGTGFSLLEHSGDVQVTMST